MRRYSLIALVVAAALLGVAQPGSTQGTIAYHQPAVPIVLRPDDEAIARQLAFSFDAGATTDLTFTYGWLFIGVRSEGETRVLIEQDPPPNIGGPVVPLPTGFSIGPNSDADGLRWHSGDPGYFEPIASYFNSFGSGPFAGQQAYMGVEFQRATGTHYGWVSLQVGYYGPVAAIDSWAWETRPGVPILAGAIPEPSTWALLVGGGLLMVWFRRRRNETKG